MDDTPIGGDSRCCKLLEFKNKDTKGTKGGAWTETPSRYWKRVGIVGLSGEKVYGMGKGVWRVVPSATWME